MNKQHTPPPTNQPTPTTTSTSQAHEQPKPAVASGGYVCPLTGEVLPCPDCCPLNSEQRS